MAQKHFTPCRAQCCWRWCCCLCWLLLHPTAILCSARWPLKGRTSSYNYALEMGRRPTTHIGISRTWVARVARACAEDDGPGEQTARRQAVGRRTGGRAGGEQVETWICV